MELPKKIRIVCVVGARPNFMKIAPLMRAIGQHSRLEGILVHTGQHYDERMKATFFDELDIPTPDVDLEVGSGTHATQTAEIMIRFEPVVDRERPDVVLVVGDVNSTIACALVAVKKQIPVIHVESGLRSFDRSMPEEINRLLTDQISTLLFTTEEDARNNLLGEGISESKIRFVGNVMIDTLRYNLARKVPIEDVLETVGDAQSHLEPGGFGVLTLHRPSNVDSDAVFGQLMTTLRQVSQRLPIVFPAHPRTKCRLDHLGADALLGDRIHLIEPQTYLSMLSLLSNARMVLTDSGGIQEETTALGIPCLTLRPNTERPITVSEGTNTVVGTDPDEILLAFNDVLETGGKVGRVPPLWDGNAAERICDEIAIWYEQRYQN